MTDPGHYHLHLHNISRESGHNIHAAVAYRHGTRMTSMDAAVAYRHAQMHGSGEAAFDYRGKVGVEWFGIVAPDDAPAWMRDPVSLWRAVDHLETRKNARLAREIIIGLPHQVDLAEHIAMLTAFARTHCIDPHRLIADIAIHAPPIHQGGDPRNWHAHILLTDRPVDRDGFVATKDRRTQSKTWLRDLREGWAKIHNDRMQALGLPYRIDHRTLDAQRRDAVARNDILAAIDLDRIPQIHVGKALHANHPSYAAYKDRRDRNAAILQTNRTRIDDLNGRMDTELAHQRQRAFVERRDNQTMRRHLDEPTFDAMQAAHGRPKPRTYIGHLHALALAGEAQAQALALSRAHNHPWHDHGHDPRAPSLWDALAPKLRDASSARNVFTVTAKDLAFAFYKLGFVTIRELRRTLDHIDHEQQVRRAERESRRTGKPVIAPSPRVRPPIKLPTPELQRLFVFEQRKAGLMVIATKRHDQEKAVERRREWMRYPHRAENRSLAPVRGRARHRVPPEQVHVT